MEMFAEKMNVPCSECADQHQIIDVLKNERRRSVAYESPEFSEAFMNLAKENGQPEIVTVDVFDTFLLRGNESEIKRFKDIADLQAAYLTDMGYLGYDGDDLLAARLSATKVSYRASLIKQGCREGSLIDIYRILVKACLSLPDKICEALLNIEIRYEQRELRLNNGLFQLLKKLNKAGSEIVLVSDMYMHKEHIQILVQSHCPQWSRVVTDIISSADTTVSKASGKLFDLLGEQHSWSFGSWLHMGDAEKGDVLRPRQKGINAIYLPVARETLKKRELCEQRMRDYLRPKGLDYKMFNA